MSRPCCAPCTVPSILAGIGSNGICAHFTDEKMGHRSHMVWPRCTSCTRLPPEGSSLRAPGSPPCRPHSLAAPRVSALPPAFLLVFPPLFVSSRQGPYRCGTRPNSDSLPTASVTNCPLLGNLKQHNFSSSHSGGQESNMGLTQLKSRYWYSLIPSGVSGVGGSVLAFPPSTL